MTEADNELQKNFLEQHFGNDESTEVRTMTTLPPWERAQERERQSEMMGEVTARRSAGLHAARDIVM